MTRPLSSSESRLVVAATISLAIAIGGPSLAQHASYHAFADQRVFGPVPHAGDVLSNLAFACAGLFGFWRLARARLEGALQWLGALACGGLLLTAAASSWYHWHPDDAGLLVDRLGMTAAFAGLLGFAACRISERAGLVVAASILVAAPVSLAVYARTGNLLPWAVLQGGGMVLLVTLAFKESADALPVRWGLVAAGYAIAKLLEWQDHAIWDLTGQLVSGHALKHVVAALAVLPVFFAWQPAPRRHNEPRRLPQGA